DTQRQHSDTAVLRRNVERCRAAVAEEMTSQPDVRRVSRRAAFFAEARLIPLDACVGIGTVLEQLPGELNRGDLAGLLWRSDGCVADAGGAIGPRLAQPRDGVERRPARIGEV